MTEVSPMWDFVVLAFFFAVLVIFFVWASRRGRRDHIDTSNGTEPNAEQHRRNDENGAGQG